MREKPEHHIVGARKIGDLESSASTPPLICSFYIILYMCKVVNVKSDAFTLISMLVSERRICLISRVNHCPDWLKIEHGDQLLNDW